MIPPKSQRPSAKAIPFLWVKLPSIHPTKVLFVKDKLPDRIILPPSLNTSGPAAKTSNLYA
jgi:hypothetical protein